MIDYIKINDLIVGLKVQELLDFEVKVNQNTGEELIHKKKSAYLKNLVFTITPGGNFVKCQGSIHKYANEGKNNNNRFTFERFLIVANALKEYISPDDVINTIEFGLNIQTPFDPSVFITNLIAHIKKPFNRTITPEKVYSQVEYSHFLVKIYNKGLQQGTNGTNLLRIEIKYLRMQKLFKNGLRWSDLMNIKTWHYLGGIIKKKFDEVIYYDPSIDINKVSEKDRLLLEKGDNPKFWEKQTGPHVSRKRKEFQSLIRKYGTMFNNISELINYEVKEVVKSYHNSDTEEEGIKKGNNKEVVKSYHNSDTGKYGIKLEDIKEVVKSYPLLYGNNSPIRENTSSTEMSCIVTGIDISMQKKGSRFLSIEGIRFLYKNDRQAYNELLSQLPSKWHNVSIDVQIYKIAHHIRDQYFNPRNSIRRAIKKLYSEPSLFDNRKLISKEKLKIANTQ